MRASNKALLADKFYTAFQIRRRARRSVNAYT